MSRLNYSVKRGKNTGISLTPHWFVEDGGHFRAHRTNSRSDPDGKRVKTERELIELVRLGYNIRMSNPEMGHAP
jgi:hypothetical protein